jgi:Family of unknown function (DUF5681)
MANHESNGSSRSAEPEDAPATPRAGYGNPPLETRFPPGRSGNPGGRPRGAKGHKQIVSEIANEMHSIVEDGKRRSRSTLELVLLQLRNLAAQGNVQAFRAYNDLIAKYSPQETKSGLGYLVVPEQSATPEEWERVVGVKLRAYQRRLAEEAEREGTPCDWPSVGELG